MGLGALGAASSLIGAEGQRATRLAQASQLRAQGKAARQNAELERARGERAAREVDRERKRRREEFEDIQARNRSMLAAGNVDMTSGSALAVSEGNIDRYAADVADTAYRRAMTLWESGVNAQNLDYQGRAADANASYLQRTAGNLGTSILRGAVGGATGFVSGYSMAGGKLGTLFGAGKAPTYWDRALQKFTTSNPIH